MRLEAVSDPGLDIGHPGTNSIFGRRGVVYVNDPTLPHLLVLDSLLAQVATIGGKGEGPGEFLSKRIKVLGDSLLVYDSRLQRVTIFSEEHFDSSRIARVPYDASNLWRLPGPDRRHLIQRAGVVHAEGETGQEDVDVLSILDESAQAMVVDTVLAAPNSTFLTVRSPSGVMAAPNPYRDVNNFTVLSGGGFAYLNTRALAVTVFDADGKRTGSFSYPTIPIPVSPEHFNATLERQSPEMAAALREGAPYVWPPVSRLFADDSDRIWILMRARPGETDKEFAVFTRDGLHVTSMRLPEDVWPRAIRGHKLLAVSVDDVDVPTIHLYRILWKDGQGPPP